MKNKCAVCAGRIAGMYPAAWHCGEPLCLRCYLWFANVSFHELKIATTTRDSDMVGVYEVKDARRHLR